MDNLNNEMERVRENRKNITKHLHKNTIEMRLLAAEARAAGLGVLKIAESLGVTHRTVYLWLKG